MNQEGIVQPSPPNLDEVIRQYGNAVRGREPVSGHLALYRELVWKTVRGTLETQMPFAAKHAGVAFDERVRDFLCSDAFPNSAYVRDLCPAFLSYVAASKGTPLPVYFLELAQHEVSQYMVAALDREIPPCAEELLPERPVVLHPCLHLAHYNHAVHEVANETQAPRLKPSWLLTYRDANFDIQTAPLTPFQAALVQGFQQGLTLAVAMVQACTASGTPFDQPAVASFLADLAERGILLGSLHAASDASQKKAQ